VFVLAVGVIAAWIVTGPIFGFSDTWQLVINTGTTMVTFLMVFLIQNTQYRDTEAIQVKNSMNSSAQPKARITLFSIWKNWRRRTSMHSEPSIKRLPVQHEQS
jgi:low affinity Fe/Cu permease